METIMECDPSDECEDETSFLNVKRPGRKSSFFVKHSTPFTSEVSELTAHMLSEIDMSHESLRSRKTYQGSIASKQILHSGISSARGTLSPVQSLNEEDSSSSSLSLHLPEPITLPTKTDRRARKIRMKSIDGDEVSIQHLKEKKRSKARKFSEFHEDKSRDKKNTPQKRARKSQEKKKSLDGDSTQDLQQMRNRKIKKIKGLSQNLRVRNWEIRQLKNIDEATKHELVIE